VLGTNPGSKLEKAKSLNVKTVSYNDLVRMIEDRAKHPRLF
jgi:NAD-dependent DNA ligase